MNRKTDIILIEDNPDEAELTIRELKKNNLAGNLVHFDDGAEALDFIFSNGKHASEQEPLNLKLILLDLKMPKMNGLEILRQLKSDEQTRTIPVVVLTSSREEKDIRESYRLGANSYIVKPVNFDSFSKAISELGHYWTIVNQGPVSSG